MTVIDVAGVIYMTQSSSACLSSSHFLPYLLHAMLCAHVSMNASCMTHCNFFERFIALREIIHQLWRWVGNDHPFTCILWLLASKIDLLRWYSIMLMLSCLSSFIELLENMLSCYLSVACIAHACFVWPRSEF